MNSSGYNPVLWNPDFLQNEYQIPSSPNPQKFSNLQNNFAHHAPVLIIHKSEDQRKKNSKENDEILPEITLPGQLISIIRGNGGKADLNFILEKIEPLFPHLRRINGRKYAGKLMKTVIGGLHSTEIFQFDSFNNMWELKEDLAKKYEKKTVEKFKLWQKKISKKQKSELQIKRKSKGIDKKKADTEANIRKMDPTSNDSFHNLKDFGSEVMHQNDNSFNHAEFGSYLMSEGNDLNDFKKEEELIFENNLNNNLKHSPNPFPMVHQFQNHINNNNEDSNTLRSDDKTQIIKKKKRMYKRSYEKYNIAFKCLDKVMEYMLDKNYSNLIKNPFTNLNGNESPEDIIQKIGTENIIGVIRCFDYFKPLVMENLEKKKKMKSLMVKGDMKKNNFINLAKDVSDIKNKLNNIFNHKN